MTPFEVLHTSATSRCQHEGHPATVAAALCSGRSWRNSMGCFLAYCQNMRLHAC